MKRLGTPTIVTVALLCLGVVLPVGGARAQTAKDLVGTWEWVSVDTTAPDGAKAQPFGPNPKGYVIFDSNGHFAYLLTRPGGLKFAANKRDQGTVEENRNAVQGSLGYSGTYSISDKTLTLKIEASTYPNDEGKELKRLFTLAGDELSWTNPVVTIGGTAVVMLRRTK